MELLLVVISLFLIYLSIKGIGLKNKIKSINKALCIIILILGSLYSIYSAGGDIIVLFLGSLVIAQNCLLVLFASWITQMISNIVHYK